MLCTETNNDNNYYNYSLFFDGCCKGNPGKAGAGIVIYNKTYEIFNKTKFIGDMETNNSSEYNALLLGLKEARSLNIDNLSVYGDSKLVINQMNGLYKVKNKNMIVLYDKCKKIEKMFNNIHYFHVYRNKNKRADELANNALFT